MPNKTAVDYVREGLIRDGKDGLRLDACFCGLDDLKPCEDIDFNRCSGAYKVIKDMSGCAKTECGDYDGYCNGHCYKLEKPEPECLERSSVEVIREMNPGKDIPTGAEMAARLAGQKLKDNSENPDNVEGG